MVFQHRYRVIRCIKAGGMGAVYEVLDERTNSPRALKVMLPSIVEDADLRARFALEAKIKAVGLKHRAIGPGHRDFGDLYPKLHKPSS